MHAAKSAIAKIVNLLPEDSFFFVVTGSSKASVVFPLTNATPANKERAIASIKAIDAGGGTVISNWLTEALEQFKKMPNAVRQALLLTDGQNDAADEERLKSVLQLCEGVFQCDCRGVGTDWRVKQLQQISNKLYS
jgi:secreted protein with Ig-like and vWFA domain